MESNIVCSKCEIHCKYLERIIAMQNEEIQYLKLLVPMKTPQMNSSGTPEREREITQSVFDVIDHKATHDLEIEYLLTEFECTCPAKNQIINVTKFLVYDHEYVTLIRNKNSVTYLDSNNKLISQSLDEFGIILFSYIFDKLRPIIENFMSNTIQSNEETKKDNNRTMNIMLLKDSKICQEMIKKVV